MGKKHRIDLEKNSIYICIVVMVIVFILDTLIPLGVAGGVPYIVVILLSLWHQKNSVTIILAILSTLLTVAGFFSSPMGGELWKVIFNRSLAIFAIWSVTILSLQRKNITREKEEAVKLREQALSELKILQGYIPICASCKQIRDEKGAWNQLEQYIRNHSEAKFSHSICPDCAKKLYPELHK